METTIGRKGRELTHAVTTEIPQATRGSKAEVKGRMNPDKGVRFKTHTNPIRQHLDKLNIPCEPYDGKLSKMMKGRNRYQFPEYVFIFLEYDVLYLIAILCFRLPHF